MKDFNVVITLLFSANMSDTFKISCAPYYMYGGDLQQVGLQQYWERKVFSKNVLVGVIV